MGVDAWTQWKIGPLSDPLLQFLDTAQTQQRFSFLAKRRAKKKLTEMLQTAGENPTCPSRSNASGGSWSRSIAAES